MNYLKVLFKNTETNEVIHLIKEIDFIPSKGLIIYQPIYAEIGLVVYDKEGFTASLTTSIEPTNPDEQLKYLYSIGFKNMTGVILNSIKSF